MKFCWAVRRSLVAYLEGELERGQVDAVDGHVRGCPRCHSELEELRRVSLLVRALPTPSRPAIYWPHAMARLQEKIRSCPQPDGWRLWDHLEGWLGSLPQAMLPVTLGGVAVVNTLVLLGLEEESFVFFVSFLAPLILD